MTALMAARMPSDSGLNLRVLMQASVSTSICEEQDRKFLLCSHSAKTIDCVHTLISTLDLQWQKEQLCFSA